MTLHFRPGFVAPEIVDLSDPSDDLHLDTRREDVVAAVRDGDVARLAELGGQWAAVAKDGVTVRLARTLGRPLRYFVAKHATGPFLVVGDRIDAIAAWCAGKGVEEQFHPSYTRMVPAHYLVELDQIGCPDPNPRYTRFFSPAFGGGPADRDQLGRRYLEALAGEVGRMLAALPASAPVGVAFSGGADSTATAAVLLGALRARGEEDRARLYTLSIGGGDDLESARRSAEALGASHLLQSVEVDPRALDLEGAVRRLEDYRPLDVQCGAVMRALLAGLRELRPELVFLFDGDGGDENWRSYPLEDSELTIKSVLNNPLLYHEGWGVDSIKHSLTYSGGLSRGIVRGFAPARELGFRLLSPHASRPVIAAAISAPLRELVGEEPERLYALKGEIVTAGLRSLGFEVALPPKKRFQEGATTRTVFEERLRASRRRLRRAFEDLYPPPPPDHGAEADGRPAAPHGRRVESDA